MMMTLQRMHDVVATLNEDWESPVADELVRLWANDGSRPKYVRASANFVFFFTDDRGRYRVLRFVHEAERDRNAVEAELAVVERMAAAGVPVACPIRSANQRLLELVSTDYGVFYVAAFQRVFGEQHCLEDGLGEARLRKWGRTLGVIHNCSLGTAGAGRPSWEDHAREAQVAFRDDPLLRTALVDLIEELRALPRTTGNFGLIHFDFELDNIVWRGDEPVAIDFDDCAQYWYAADIAFALRDLFDDNATSVALDDPSLRSFVSGYREVRRLPDEELERLPLFLRFHHCTGWVRIQRSLTPPTSEELPWVPDLRAKLANSADELRSILLG